MSKISDLFSSPLSNIINIPKTENKLLKASLYNCLAVVLLFIIAASTISVYFLFEIFIKPLMWAVLVGTCIFPFKRSFTGFLRTWIIDIDKSGKPLVLGVTLTPFYLFNSFANLLTEVIVRRFKLFLFYIFGIPMIYSIYNLGILSKLLQITATIYFMASDVLALFGSKVVSIMILTLVIMLFTSIVFAKITNVRMLKVLSSSIWILAIVHLSNLAGSFALFIFTSMMLLLFLGGVTEILNIDITNLSVSQLLLWWEFICKPYRYCSKEEESTNISEFDEEPTSEDETIDGFQSTPANEPLGGDSDFNSSNKAPSGDNKQRSKSAKVTSMLSKFDAIYSRISGLLSPIPKTDCKRSISRMMSRNRLSSLKSSKKISNKTLVSRAFAFLLWSHIIVYSWSHFTVTVVIMVALLLVAVKKIVTMLEIGDKLYWFMSLVKLKMAKMTDNKHDIFVPEFVRGSFKIFLQFDNKLKRILDAGLDSFVSVTLIALILLAAIFLTIFLALQVHNESLHLIALTSNVLNSTMSSELYSWLPEKKDVISIIETMTSNVYVYGREWISKKIDQLFDTNAYNKARLEEQALELWEKLYQRVLSQNQTNATLGSTPTLLGKAVLNRHYSVSSIQQQIWGFWDVLTSFDVLDLKKISNLVHENLGLLSTVIESLWLFVRSNINLVLSLTTGIVSAILGGGTVVLNFILSLIIFLSALFYLLAYSDQRYLPLQCISAMTPNAEDNPILQSIYLSVENGVSAVFAVTLKMACFYGFYTSLTHYIFGVNLVVIPSIIAAVLAAVPIVGTYWAAIPAITELVFVNQDYVAASILLVLHMLPMYVIDTAIYSEIKETGHPYLTGLAIAGGVCWLGLQGVVIGPLLLCTLVIVLNMFKALMAQYSAENTLPVSMSKEPHRSTKPLTKSKSCDRSAGLVTEDCNSSLLE